MSLGGINWRGPHVWIAAASLGFVLSIAVVDARKMQETSPGELATVHAMEVDLAGRGGCAQCHGGWRQSMTAACLDCHEAIQYQIGARDGVHGRLPAEAVAQCALCHSDHHGAGFALVSDRSFVLAGFEDGRKSFDHAAIGFEMAGEHLALDCAECHENADIAVLPKGSPRFVGLDQTCGNCHEDPHEGGMRLACAECHVQESFEERRFEDHDRFLPLAGGHADVTCRECHAGEETHSLEALMGVQPPPARSCEACHESPHDGALVAGVARETGTTAPESCAACHLAEHDAFALGTELVTPERHALAGFALEPPHAELDCAACHDPGLGEFAARHPGRDADRCQACHADPHGGQFDQGAFGAVDCLACHASTHFDPPEFGAPEHARTDFALTGTHEDLDCRQCHVDPVRHVETAEADDGALAARLFRDLPGRCEDCHADAHEGSFAEHADTLGIAPEGTCASCHRTTAFDDAADEFFEHGHWTGFTVDGAHEQEGCESCHARAPEPDGTGRRFGRVAKLFGPFEGCATCHRDPHAGAFDSEPFPQDVEGRAACERCHVTSSFRALEHGFDHRLWTGFALGGAHGDLACSECHAPIAPALEDGRTWERAAGTACVDCHSDPHAGQFEVRGTTDCNRCHQSARSFAELAFSHEIGTRFPLGTTHADVACAACHKVEPQPDGTSLVRFRPLGRSCTDCHGTQRQPLRRPRGRRR